MWPGMEMATSYALEPRPAHMGAAKRAQARTRSMRACAAGADAQPPAWRRSPAPLAATMSCWAALRAALSLVQLRTTKWLPPSCWAAMSVSLVAPASTAAIDWTSVAPALSSASAPITCERGHTLVVRCKWRQQRCTAPCQSSMTGVRGVASASVAGGIPE